MILAVQTTINFISVLGRNLAVSRSFEVIHFALSYRQTKGSILSYNIACHMSEVFEDVTT